jgi:hypothetical protein
MKIWLRSSLTTLFAVAFLSACATKGTAARPSLRATRDWNFEPANRDEPAKLAYGQPYTDDVDLVLWCDAPKHEVRATPVGGDDERFAQMTLRSGKLTLALGLKQNDLDGSVGTALLRAPVLAAFRSSGRLAMVLDAQPPLHLDATSSGGRRQIQAFFGACR